MVSIQFGPLLLCYCYFTVAGPMTAASCYSAYCQSADTRRKALPGNRPAITWKYRMHFEIHVLLIGMYVSQDRRGFWTPCLHNDAMLRLLNVLRKGTYAVGIVLLHLEKKDTIQRGFYFSPVFRFLTAKYTWVPWNLRAWKCLDIE